MIALAGALTGVCALPVAIKAVGELHRQHVLQSNVLSRQGNGSPEFAGAEEKLARQRTGGILGGLAPNKGEPGYLRKVPARPMTGDKRRDYEVGSLGNATSSRGILLDVLDKVPRRTVGGSGDYKRANRPGPSRKAGWGNQSFTP